MGKAFEVVAGGGEDGVDAVAFASAQEVAARPVLLLEMTDDGLNHRAPSKLAFDLSVHTALLTGSEDAQGLGRVMAGIILVKVNAPRRDTDPVGQIFDDSPEGVTVIRV